MYIHKKSVEFLILNKHLEATEMAVFHAAWENFLYIHGKRFYVFESYFKCFRVSLKYKL